MLLSKKTSIKVSREYANLIGHMCYAASKLWNVCNYERQHYKETGIEQHPDWYYQKKAHKEDLWYKQLPSPDGPGSLQAAGTRHGSLFMP